MNLSNTLPKKLILALLLVAFASGLFAKTSYSKSIYDAYIVRDMTKWETVVQSMEASRSVTTIDQKLELVSYYYGVIGYLIGKKQYLHAEQLTNKGEALIDQVLKASPKNVTATSYKGSFTGFRVGIKKFKALDLRMVLKDIQYSCTSFFEQKSYFFFNLSISVLYSVL